MPLASGKPGFTTLVIITAIMAAMATFLSFFGGESYDLTTKPNIDGIHLDVSCAKSTLPEIPDGIVIDGNQSRYAGIKGIQSV
jgi:hypothetical protein